MSSDEEKKEKERIRSRKRRKDPTYKAKMREYGRKSRENPDNREKHNARARKWAKENPERRMKTIRKRLYGLTPEEYEQKLIEQDYKCACCGEAEVLFDRRIDRPRSMAVDHDHKTGKVRGLVCMRCNTRLGVLESEWRGLGESYLAKHRN